MQNHESLEKSVRHKYSQKDKRKKPKMKVSGKKIFQLKKLMEKSRGKRIQKLKKHK